jgi:hypothetical protein
MPLKQKRAISERVGCKVLIAHTIGLKGGADTVNIITGYQHPSSISWEKLMDAVPLKPSLWTENLPVQTTVNPKLAAEIGLNESLVLLQIAFWINHSDNLRDDAWWTYQSLEDMKEKAFPYWSIATISRIINNLVSGNLLKKTDSYNKRKNDRTQWFSLNIDGLSKLKSIKVILQNAKTISQNAKSTLQNETTLPENTPEETHKQNTTPLPPAGNATDGNKPTQGAPSELSLMQEAVRTCLKQYGRQNEQVSKALLRLHVGKNAEFNLSRKFTPALLEKMVSWWDENYRKNGQPLTRPKNMDSVKSYGEIFLESLSLSQKPKQVEILHAEPARRPSVKDFVVFEKPEQKKAAGG